MARHARHPIRLVRLAAPLALALGLGACDKEPESQTAAPTPTAAPSATATPEAAPLAETPPAKGEPTDPNELCAKVIVIAHSDSEGIEGFKRTKEMSKSLAEKVRAEVEGGADFVEVATRESNEERSVKKRAGLGTFHKDDWPERYEGLVDPLLATEHGQLTPVVSIPLGWAFAKRCAVDKVHTRHLLVRYAGAERAPEETTRSKAEAKTRAEEAHAKIAGGAEFADVAAEYGEDGSAKKGGDLGPIGRGMFVTPYEDAAWALKPGELAPVVEGPFGFHVVRREK